MSKLRIHKPLQQRWTPARAAAKDARVWRRMRADPRRFDDYCMGQELLRLAKQFGPVTLTGINE